MGATTPPLPRPCHPCTDAPEKATAHPQESGADSRGWKDIQICLQNAFSLNHKHVHTLGNADKRERNSPTANTCTSLVTPGVLCPSPGPAHSARAGPAPQAHKYPARPALGLSLVGLTPQSKVILLGRGRFRALRAAQVLEEQPLHPAARQCQAAPDTAPSVRAACTSLSHGGRSGTYSCHHTPAP